MSTVNISTNHVPSTYLTLIKYLRPTMKYKPGNKKPPMRDGDYIKTIQINVNKYCAINYTSQNRFGYHVDWNVYWFRILLIDNPIFYKKLCELFERSTNYKMIPIQFEPTYSMCDFKILAANNNLNVSQTQFTQYPFKYRLIIEHVSQI
jgi:hypothetical protein